MVLQYGMGRVEAGWHVCEHIPPGYVRVYYVHGGSVRYTDEAGERMLLPEHLYWFPSNKPYQMVQREEDPLVCTHLHLDVSPDVVDTVAALPVMEDPFLLPYLAALEQAVSAKNTRLVDGMAECLVEYGMQRQVVVPLTVGLSEATAYIAAHLEEPLEVSSLARMAGYTRQHFSRLFKQTMGLTPYQYIIGLRMKRASDLLKRGASVAHAAAQTGYADGKVFSRAFAGRFGMPPGQWKKQYRPMP